MFLFSSQLNIIVKKHIWQINKSWEILGTYVTSVGDL